MESYNNTLLAHIPFRVPNTLDYEPFYAVHRPRLVSGCSDVALTLIIPFVCYWAYSLVFHALDATRIPYFEKHRLHEPDEVTKRNKVTLSEVVYAVLLQQLFQTLLGAVGLEDEGQLVTTAQHDAALALYASRFAHYGLKFMGPERGARFLLRYGLHLTMAWYWWVYPILQMFFAFFVLDTWQYFVHRGMHVNKWLYRHIHARHHRLYVPYACGALYNHPFEGFVMDTLGTFVAHLAAGLSARQDMILFGISTLKTVDDHSGYALPWDPFQMLFGNNADYHDIHHQQFGIKKNFAQPWFIHWDVVLGTRMTRDQVPKRSHTDLRDENLKTGKGSRDVLVNKKTD